MSKMDLFLSTYSDYPTRMDSLMVNSSQEDREQKNIEVSYQMFGVLWKTGNLIKM